jgi:hypothetical protein
MFLTIRLRWPDYQQLRSEGLGGNSHDCCFRLCRDPIAVAWGLAGDEEAGRGRASVNSLMVLAGGDFEAFAGVKDEVVMLYFESEFSFEHEEELACACVVVAYLAGAGRHELFDDAELGRFDKVPAVAVGALWASPLVVFRVFCADDLCRHTGSPQVRKSGAGCDLAADEGLLGWRGCWVGHAEDEHVGGVVAEGNAVFFEGEDDAAA